LLDLALHRSGLPAVPPGFLKAKSPGRPLADFTVESLYAFLATYQLTRDIDVKTEISLIGYGLLGQALSYAAGEDFGTLLRQHVLVPLEMPETRLAGAGPFDSAVGLRSTVRDLLQFLGATLGHTASALAATIRQLRRTRDARGHERPIGWMTFSVDGAFAAGGHEILWMDGFIGVVGMPLAPGDLLDLEDAITRLPPGARRVGAGADRAGEHGPRIGQELRGAVARVQRTAN